MRRDCKGSNGVTHQVVGLQHNAHLAHPSDCLRGVVAVVVDDHLPGWVSLREAILAVVSSERVLASSHEVGPGLVEGQTVRITDAITAQGSCRDSAL